MFRDMKLELVRGIESVTEFCRTLFWWISMGTDALFCEVWWGVIDILESLSDHGVS